MPKIEQLKRDLKLHKKDGDLLLRLTFKNGRIKTEVTDFLILQSKETKKDVIKIIEKVIEL